LNGQNQRPAGSKPGWRDSNGFLITLALIVGPFAIPFIWLNRRLSVAAKVLWTAVLVILTFALYRTTTEAVDRLSAQFKQAGLL
jgi:hypothetical protein